MLHSIQILVITVSIISGIICIFFTHQMSQKYRLAYLSTYYYYLIFLFIFGIYGLLGTRIIRILLMRISLDINTIETISLFNSFLGMPFLILSLYMFYRLCREIVNKSVSLKFNLIYFVILSILFLSYGIILIKIAYFGETRFEMIRQTLLVVFSAISGIIYLSALGNLFIYVRKLLDSNDRKAVRLFGYFYLVISISIIILINIKHLHPILGLGSVILLFISHLLPILFLNIYLDRHFIEPMIADGYSRGFKDFIEKYGISRREEEIIQLICKGSSNHEISESLFISLQTVKDHVHRIYLKTGVKNRVQLTNLILSFS